MATRSVRFTGTRTGLKEIVVPRHGLIMLGDVLEVDSETAKVWTTALPTADGTAADFEYVKAEKAEVKVEKVEQPATSADEGDK
jgi:hypothetical protein